MQCCTPWQSDLHIFNQELLVLLAVLSHGKAVYQDISKSKLDFEVFLQLYSRVGWVGGGVTQIYQ